jgi:hypothetical protein
MSVTVTTTPSYPVIAKGAKLSFTLSGGGNFVRLWCTAAPLGSKLRAQLDQSDASRVEIFSGDATPSSAPFLFQPDVPGQYVIAAQEYRRGASSYGGGYAGDPKGFNSETKTDAAETTTSVVFGERLTMTLGIAPDTATLVLYVFDDTIRQTTFALHGENSPAMIDPKSNSAKTAVLTIGATAIALIGLTASTALGNTSTIVVDMINKFSGHFGRTTASTHAAPDNYNVPNTAFAFPKSKGMTLKAVGELIAALTLHMNTDQARRTPFVSSGIGTGNWHNPTAALVVADGENAVIAPAPTNMEQAYIGLADCWRAFEAHRIDLDVHGSADNVNVLAVPPILMAVHAEFLDVIRRLSPPPDETENPGVPVLVGGAGMKAS